MLESAQSLGWFAGILLIVAVIAWVKLFRGPKLQAVGDRGAASVSKVEIASQLLVLAAGLSGIAAILAVAGWMFA